MCHSCNIILQTLWTPVYVIVTLWFVMSIWMEFYGIFVSTWMCGTAYNTIIFFYIYKIYWYINGIFLCVSSDMLLLSVNSNCVVLFCVLSIHLPLVLLFSLWQFCYWYEIPIKPFVFFFTTIRFLAKLSICCFSSLLCTLLSNFVFVIL